MNEEENEKQNQNREEKLKKVNLFSNPLFKVICIVLAIAIAICGIVTYGVYRGFIKSKFVSDVLYGLNTENHTIAIETSSSLYTPEKNALSVDEDTGIAYINNIVLIFFEKETSEEEVNRIIDSIGGTIVGSIPIIHQYQVQIEPHNLEELQQICDSLEQNECVFEAIFDMACKISQDAIPDDSWKKWWRFK